MKVYTRKGDKGNTSLFNGECVPKDHPAIEALGAVDECNSAIGSALSHLPDFAEPKTQLEHIQHALFDLGAALATPRTRAVNAKIDQTRFDHDATELLENWIDQMDEQLPEIHTFVLPGGHPASAHLHLARSICRRAECLIFPLHQSADVSEHVLKYMNRLSDYLFVQARFINHLTQSKENLWQKHHQI